MAQYPAAVLAAAYINCHSRTGAKTVTPKDLIYLPYPTEQPKSDAPSREELISKIKALFGDPDRDLTHSGVDPAIDRITQSR